MSDFVLPVKLKIKENNKKHNNVIAFNETTYFGLLGYHNVAKFYDTKYGLCVASVEISSARKIMYEI